MLSWLEIQLSRTGALMAPNSSTWMTVVAQDGAITIINYSFALANWIHHYSIDWFTSAGHCECVASIPGDRICIRRVAIEATRTRSSRFEDNLLKLIKQKHFFSGKPKTIHP